MTSKKALETLFEILCEREHTNSEHNFWLKLFNDVAKDLEVLEILKNILKIKKSDLYEFEIIVRGSDEQENKIKEWLENDNI